MTQRDQQKKIKGMLDKGANRYDINMDEIRQSNPDLAKYITKNPIESINMFEQQLDRIVQDMRDDHKGGNTEKTAVNTGDKAFPTKVKKYYINFDGNFGKNHVTPRGLKANLVN